MRLAAPVARLDEFAPTWQFAERHWIAVRATPEGAYRAIRTVTAGEIRFFRALTWLRRLGRTGPANILNPPVHLPILDVALRSGFLLLADEPNREVVVGMVVIAPHAARRPANAAEFRTLDAPGHAKATLSFSIEPGEPAGCVVATETRVYTTDRATRRRFGMYWRVIYPGSALIRRMWLRAIKRRAEQRGVMQA